MQALQAMILRVFNNHGINGLDDVMIKLYADKFWSGVTNGFGEDIVSADFNTPDYNMLAQLQKNVWQFSAAKNYQQLRELTAALLAPDGTMREFNDFKTIAMQMSEKWVGAYLQTEYNLAIAGAQMASKWLNISEHADTLPLLKFNAVLDTQTTELCRSLDGTTLPINHPFWNVYYPPNHFNCRSTVDQLQTGHITPEDKIPSADIPKMFRTNLAKTGLIFPEDHPYFTDIPKEVLEEAQKLMPKK